MSDCHTGEYQYGLVVEPTNVLVPNWRHQLIGIKTDGVPSMIGCVQGACTRLSNECLGNFIKFGGAHLNLVVKKALNECMDEKFLKTLTGVISMFHFSIIVQCCEDIASIMAGTSSVNWTKDPSLQSLTDFSLESILHCMQYQKLRDFVI